MSSALDGTWAMIEQYKSVKATYKNKFPGLFAVETAELHKIRSTSLKDRLVSFEMIKIPITQKFDLTRFS